MQPGISTKRLLCIDGFRVTSFCFNFYMPARNLPLSGKQKDAGGENIVIPKELD